MTKELVVPGVEFALMKPEINIAEVIRENLGGESISITDLTRVKVPGGGGTTWSIPTIDGDVETKAIDGIIVETYLTRGYWRTEYGKGGANSPPDCFSHDAIKGIGDPGGDCVTCPYAQFGSGANSRSQACKMRRLLFIARPDSLLPVVVSVPSGSLKSVKKYLIDLSGRNLMKHEVVTRLTLEKRKNEDSIDYAFIVFNKIGELEANQLASIKSYVEAIRPYLAQVTRTIASEGDADVGFGD